MTMAAPERSSRAPAEAGRDVASFVLRFTQDLYEDEAGEPRVRWRGHIRHVQSDADARFTDDEGAKRDDLRSHTHDRTQLGRNLSALSRTGAPVAVRIGRR